MKKWISGILCGIMLLIMAFAFAGCKPRGNFYSLKEAYEKGLLEKENIQTIADYHNNKTSAPEPLSDKMAMEIKEEWSKKWKMDSGNCFDIATDEVGLMRYYGYYDNVYVVFLSYGQYIDLYAPCEFEIEGIVFSFSHANYMDGLVVYQK